MIHLSETRNSLLPLFAEFHFPPFLESEKYKFALNCYSLSRNAVLAYRRVRIPIPRTDFAATSLHRTRFAYPWIVAPRIRTKVNNGTVFVHRFSTISLPLERKLDLLQLLAQAGQSSGEYVPVRAEC